MALRIFKPFRNYVLVGLFLITPIVVTGSIVQFLFNFFLKNKFTRFLVDQLYLILPETLKDSIQDKVLIHILVIFVMLLSLFMIGLLARSFFGRKLYRLGESILARIPFISRIYSYLRQIVETILAQRKTLFSEVVMIEYPRKGLYSIAFVSSPVPNNFKDRYHDVPLEEEIVSLFIPTTPNPTSGLMIMAPRHELTTLPLTVAEAMQFIVSAGAVHPGDNKQGPEHSLLVKVEEWFKKTQQSSDAPPPLPMDER